MTTTTTAAAADVRVLRAAATERVKARRTGWTSYSDAERRQAWLEGRELPRQSINDPAFAPPSSLAEFADDLVITWGALPFEPGPALAVIADAVRDGREAAVRAVRAARRLTRAEQWAAYQNIDRARHQPDAARTGADRVLLAVLGEWSRLKLADTDPEDD
jgi:hypothetical protein